MKLGDVIRLRSGGAAMTVEVAGEKVVACVWFDTEHKLHRDSFKVADLQIV